MIIMNYKKNKIDNITIDKIFKYYRLIDFIKKYTVEAQNKNGALDFLKDFYVNVWGIYQEYTENDVILYNLFDKQYDGNELIIEARVGLLDSMYSTNINNISQIIEIIRSISCNINNGYSAKCVNCSIDLIQNKKSNNKNSIKTNESVSFFSKYFHWYNEVNKFDPIPIYDLNVRIGLIIYNFFDSSNESFQCFMKNCFNHNFNRYIDEEKLERNTMRLKESNNEEDLKLGYLKSETIKKRMNYDNVGKLLDGLIKKLDIDKETKRIDITANLNQKLTTNISIYRLVDKYLWLTYKVSGWILEIEDLGKENDDSQKKKLKNYQDQNPIKTKIIKAYCDLIHHIPDNENCVCNFLKETAT